MIIIHLGLHKTGTTFLQRNVFPFSKEINYIYGDKLRNLNIVEDKVNVLSGEWLSGTPHEPEPVSRRYELAYSLSILFPNAKILLVLRNKDDWVNSIYKQYVLSGGKEKKKKFVEYIFDDGYLKFVEYIFYLKDLFNDVKIMYYEDLKNNPNKFLSDLFSFLRVKNFRVKNIGVNVSYSDRQIEIIRLLNIFIPNKIVRRYFWIKVRQTISLESKLNIKGSE